MSKFTEAIDNFFDQNIIESSNEDIRAKINNYICDDTHKMEDFTDIEVTDITLENVHEIITNTLAKMSDEDIAKMNNEIDNNSINLADYAHFSWELSPKNESEELEEADADANLDVDADVANIGAEGDLASLKNDFESAIQEITTPNDPTNELVDSMGIAYNDNTAYVSIDFDKAALDAEYPGQEWVNSHASVTDHYVQKINDLGNGKWTASISPNFIEDSTESTIRVVLGSEDDFETTDERMDKAGIEFASDELPDLADKAKDVKFESENLTEATVPASQLDFKHRQLSKVQADIEVIAGLKSEDTANDLYTDLLDAYDKVVEILTKSIAEDPVGTVVGNDEVGLEIDNGSKVDINIEQAPEQSTEPTSDEDFEEEI